ncbi:MAG TPA: hypothetical protein VLE97_11590 [Gaiellaceae bacterium]|nr:hypothetical protein [Gaiellaceae bacterium]
MTADEVVAMLLDLGFSPAGETRQEHVRIPTMRSPVLGGMGGERRTLGGRARYALPGTDLRVTVGPRTTNVYFSRGAGKTEFVLNEKTKDLTRQQLRDTVAAATGKAP